MVATPDDVKKVLTFACYDPPEGHGWDPSDRLTWWSGGTVPSSPRCRECVRLWKMAGERIGLVESEMVRLFEKLGTTYAAPEREVPIHRLGAEDQMMLGVRPLDAWKKQDEARFRREEQERWEELKPVITIVAVDPDDWSDWHEAQNEVARRAWDAAIEAREKGEMVKIEIVKYRKREDGES